MKESYLATHLMVLFDRDGRILAGVPVYDGYAGPVPLAGKDQEVARFDLPEGARPPRAGDRRGSAVHHVNSGHAPSRFNGSRFDHGLIVRA
jgi:hypothetical protein